MNYFTNTQSSINRLTKYFLVGAGDNFTAFELDHAQIGLGDSSISFKGNSGIDAVCIANGFSFDFTENQGRADFLYAQGSSSDFSYAYDADGDALTLTNQTVANTRIKLSPVDKVVFSNGFVIAQTNADNLPEGRLPARI